MLSVFSVGDLLFHKTITLESQILEKVVGSNIPRKW